ncbi:helix-turn-helix domain-containing protein [Kineococcus sp. NPDC059986]|uniref:helix-turn-helix domain-containing protein n=1 Tax=Kineococcus sp. NPDC059986 TaxID=3155538 RepID=UPI00344C7418
MDDGTPGGVDGVGDLVTLGRRVRHLRTARGRTLDDLAGAVGSSASRLSLLENGRREPKLSLLTALARELGVPLAELLAPEPPSRRAALEIRLEHAQRSPLYASLGLPAVRPGKRAQLELLEALVGLHDELVRRAHERAATPEQAREANVALRRTMRAQGNFFGEVEDAAAGLLDAVGYAGGPLSERHVDALAAHLGYRFVAVDDLPHSSRSVTDTRHRVIYLRAQDRVAGGPRRRGVALQALGHLVLGHGEPAGYPEFLRQRVEVNCFAAALLVPRREVVRQLQAAKAARDIAVEDVRDAFNVSYETAAHRFTNVATHDLGLPVHFMRVHESGTVSKAYENDGVLFPVDATGAIEGQPVCRHWTARTVFDRPAGVPYHQYTDTPSGTYWCTSSVDPAGDPDPGAPPGRFSVSVGVPFAHVKWFRGRETTERSQSRCPDPTCCRVPPAELADRWAAHARPSARAHSHLLAALPPGTYPGVDDTEVYRFLDAHTPR